MENAVTQQGSNRMQTTTVDAASSSTNVINVGTNSISSNNGTANAEQQTTSFTDPPHIERSSLASSSLANLLDGFTSRVTGDRTQYNMTNTSGSIVHQNSNGGDSANTGLCNIVDTNGDGTVGNVVAVASGSMANSLTSIGSTANAFYSSIGSALNSLTLPITAAAAAATATTAEAAAVVVAAASAISNHLSSPTSATPPHNDDDDDIDDEDDDEDCDENDDDEEDDIDEDEDMGGNHVPATTQRKTWAEIREIVSEIRKRLSGLSSMVPTNIQFRNLSDGRVRCYFLSTPPNAWETTLLYTDIPLNEATTNHNHRQGQLLEQQQQQQQQQHRWQENSLNDEQPSNTTDMNTPLSLPVSSSPPFITAPAFEMSSYFSNQQQQHRKKLQWHAVLQQPLASIMATSGGSGNTNVWSREFQLMQERKRLSTWGITSYELHKPSGKIVFPCFNDLYQCFDTGYSSGPLFPIQLRTCPQWAALDPQICPQNSDLIAYISGCDIWVMHRLSGHEERLTFAHDGRRSFMDDPLSAGVPSYVMQEEFSRYQGYWWQSHADDGIYRIVYEEVDESDVGLYTFPSAHSLPGEMEEYRFPRTGTANAKSKLKMVQFVLNEALQISDICIKDLPYSLSAVFPWLEYIVRVGWTPDSQFVWIQALNRKQQHLEIVLIPIDNFCETYSSSTSSPSGSTDHSWKSHISKTISPLQVIYRQYSDTWINVHDLLHFLEIKDGSITFLWASEETGFRHLYLITSSLANKSLNGVRENSGSNISYGAVTHKQQSTLFSTNTAIDCGIVSGSGSNGGGGGGGGSGGGGNNGALYSEIVDGAKLLQPRIINKVALTSGDWEVLGRNIWVNGKEQLVYFLGLRETPLEKHLYVVSLQRPEHIRQLTEPGYSYLVEFDDSCQLMLQVYCNIKRLPSCKVMRVTQTCPSGGVNGIQLSLIGYLNEGGKPEPQYCPQIFSPQLPSGDIVYAMIFKPHNFQMGVKYPTVLNVYGGPEVQTVNNTFKGKHQLRMHMLAAQGYCVICIDSRGSRHRGTKFEGHIRCRMGQVELNDQVDALRILADQLGYIDMNRIAIHGWSYGGYLSLMGLIHYPNIFKVAIAGAPVTNWEFYDTGYTERYMDLPQNNKQGYAAGSILNYIHLFPDEDNRLLLIHGLVDENVHFYHTSQLVNALNKANKPYTLHIFPDERHSLRNLESNKNYETKLLSFLQNL